MLKLQSRDSKEGRNYGNDIKVEGAKGEVGEHRQSNQATISE